MHCALIEFHVPDFAPVREFYGLIGFEVCREHPAEDRKGYLVLALEENVLCFWGGNDCIYTQEYFKRFGPESPKGVGVEVVLQVEDVRQFYNRVKDKVAILEPLKMRAWGLEDFRLLDPFGFYLRFTSRHDIKAYRSGEELFKQ
jgi:hypothetical protein